MQCLFIVFRPLIYENYRSKLEKRLNYQLFQDIFKKMLEYVFYFYINGSAALKYIIQITSFTLACFLGPGTTFGIAAVSRFNFIFAPS